MKARQVRQKSQLVPSPLEKGEEGMNASSSLNGLDFGVNEVEALTLELGRRLDVQSFEDAMYKRPCVDKRFEQEVAPDQR
jgi:hypothetical protein